MRRLVGVGIGMSVLAVATAGCASNKENARDAAIEDMRAQLAEISDSAMALIEDKGARQVSGRIDYLYGPDVYRHSSTETTATWDIILAADASYSEFIGHHQASVGACIKMTAHAEGDVETDTIQCPKDLWKRDDVHNYDEEVDILDE